MKYFISAMVEMVGSFDNEIEADSLEDAEAMAEQIVWNLDINDICWSEEVQPYGDVEVCAEEDEDEEEDEEDHEEGVV